VSLTLEARETLDIILWFFTLSLVGSIFILVMAEEIQYVIYLILPLLIVIFLLAHNNMKGVQMQKEKRKKELEE